MIVVALKCDYNQFSIMLVRSGVFGIRVRVCFMMHHALMCDVLRCDMCA